MAYQYYLPSKLGELAISDPSHSFCCGGQSRVQLPIRLHYKQNEEVAEVVLPGIDSAAVRKLFAACRRSTSEVAGLDSGLHEFYLGSDVLTTSFQLSATAILSEIESLMIPDRCIRAELCKLNVYTGGTNSHYEGRADTLWSGETLGTLIVRLPTEFAGGTLVVHHNGQMVEFEWSVVPKSDKSNSIYWAAFFNDAEYDIHAVTSGCCLTLTYNIYSTKERIPTNVTKSLLYQRLEKALSTPHFMREGGCLGFTCRYAYNLSHLNEADRLPFVLKGSDYMIFSAARSLGLNAEVRPVVEGKDHWYLLPKFNDKILEGHKYDRKDISNHALILETLGPRCYRREMDNPMCESVISGITWCNPLPDWQSVFSLITTPVQVTAEVLHQKIPDFNNVLMQNQSEQSLQLKSAGVRNTDIHAILEAFKHLQASGSRQVVGVHDGSNIPGSHSELYACYQMAVLLVDVPQWGLSPRIATDEVAKKMNSLFDTKNLLYWEK